MIHSLSEDQIDECVDVAIATEAFTDDELWCLEQDLFEADNAFIALASDDTVAGLITLAPEVLTGDYTWVIDWIIVSPTYQRKGLAKALFSYAVAQVREAGGSQIIVHTERARQHSAAISFYEYMDMELVGEIPDYYGKGRNRLTFLLKLSSHD
jgi:ribosomal protein S18 acetylase RimI-like enzyme